MGFAISIVFTFFKGGGIDLRHIRLSFVLYISTAVIIFCVFCWTMAAMLRVVSKQIVSLANAEKVEPERLDQWQRFYYLTGSLVNKMNQCFGFTVLVFFIFIFIRMINGCYTLVTLAKDNNFGGMFGSFLVLVWPLLAFAVMSYGPHRVKHEVI